MLKQIGILSFILALAVPAFADGWQGGGPCADFIKTNCPNVQQGDHEGMHTCLTENSGKLTGKCKATFTSMEKVHAQIQAACGADETGTGACAGVSATNMKAMHECLMTKGSPGCQAALKDIMQHHMGDHHGMGGHSPDGAAPTPPSGQ